MKRLVYVVTASLTARKLLRGQLSFMREQGFEVHVIAGDDLYLDEVGRSEGVAVHHVPMAREMAPWSDLRSLYALRNKLQELKPDIVNASTPKAGLLGMVTAKSIGVPRRIYVLRGLRYETLTGAKRSLMLRAEKVASSNAERVICVSESLRKKAIAHNLFSEQKSLVLGSGSSNGVIFERFAVRDETLAQAAKFREMHRIPGDAFVIGFVGRFTRDKGMTELMDAFLTARKSVADLRLLLVGDFEAGDPLPSITRSQIETSDGVHRVGFVEEPAIAYAAMNVLVLPTYREGFPNVPIEAACAGVPTIGSDATGVVDAVVAGETGWIVEVGSRNKLTEAMLEAAANRDETQARGDRARQRAQAEFAPERIWSALAELYSD